MRDTNGEQPCGGCRRLVNRKFKHAFSPTGTVSTEQRVVNREPRKSGGQPRGWSPSFGRPKEGNPRKGRFGSPPLRGVPVLLDKARQSVQLAHSTELRYELGGRSHRYAGLTRSSPSARPKPRALPATARRFSGVEVSQRVAKARGGENSRDNGPCLILPRLRPPGFCRIPPTNFFFNQP